jgi:hypothetical protein
MNEYKSIQNISLLAYATGKMLQEKFNISLPEERLKLLVNNTLEEVEDEYNETEFKVNELNNITLSKIKQMVQSRLNPEQQASKQLQQPQQSIHLQQPAQQLPKPEQTRPLRQENKEQSKPLQQPEEPYQQHQPQQAQHQSQQPQQSQQSQQPQQPLNDDIINARLRELEAKRRSQTQTVSYSNSIQPVTPTVTPVVPGIPAMPALQQAQVVQPQQQQPQQVIMQAPPQHTRPKQFKTFIINSSHRDWVKYPNKNNLKCQIPITSHNNYAFFPDCMCFPTHVKNKTPYVLVHISDGAKNLVYTFTLFSHNTDAKWDIWKTVDDPESITLSNRQWVIKCYDFLNNELDLGIDDIQITEAALLNDDHYLLKYEHQAAGQLQANDYVLIQTKAGQQHCKKVLEHDEKDKMLTIDRTDLNIDDFISSSMMNTNNQFSFVIKYYYKD